jgi:hypothetical protein
MSDSPKSVSPEEIQAEAERTLAEKFGAFCDRLQALGHGDIGHELNLLYADVMDLLRLQEPPRPQEGDRIRSQVFMERGWCQWHDVEHLEWHGRGPAQFYCLLCEQETRRLGEVVAEPAKPASPPEGDRQTE